MSAWDIYDDIVLKSLGYDKKCQSVVNFRVTSTNVEGTGWHIGLGSLVSRIVIWVVGLRAVTNCIGCPYPTARAKCMVLVLVWLSVLF